MRIAGVLAALAFFVGNDQLQAQWGSANLNDAANTALRQTGGGRISELEFDTEDDRPVWKFEIARGGRETEVMVDAMSGRILEVESKGSVSSSKEQRLYDASVLMSEAIDQALAYAGGGRVEKVELDRESGITIYKIDIESAGETVEVHVDAATGGVLSSSDDGFTRYDRHPSYDRFGRYDRFDRYPPYGRGDRYGYYGYDDPGFRRDRGRTWGLDLYGYEGYPRDPYGRYGTRGFYLYFDDDWDDDDWEDYWEDYWDD